MLIKEVRIQNYGPIRECRYVFSPGINFIYGHNEAGKSLTLDAMVKLLLGRGAREKDFASIGRVEYEPQGCLLIEGLGGTWTVPLQGRLPGLLGITPRECANIFIVRNSNLSIAREAEFYKSVTDRLIGLRTAELNKVKSILLDMGKLTPGGNIRDVSGEKLRTRMDAALRLAEQAGQLYTEMLAVEFDRLEILLVQSKEKLYFLNTALEEADQARKRVLYQKGRAALEKLQTATNKLSRLEQFNEQDEWLWDNLERERRRIDLDIGRLRAERQEKEKAQEQLERELQEMLPVFHGLEKRKQAVNQAVCPDLEKFRTQRRALVSREKHHKLYLAFAFVSTLLLAVSLLGMVVNTNFVFWVVAMFLFPAMLFSWYLLFHLAFQRSAVEALRLKVKDLMAMHGLNAADGVGFERVIEDFTEEFEATYRAVQNRQNRVEVLSGELGLLKKRDLELEKELADVEETINNIKKKCGIRTLSEYSSRVRLKQEAEQSVREQKSVLSGLFGIAPETLGELYFWQQSVHDLSYYSDAVPGVEFSEKNMADLKVKRENCQKYIDEISGILNDYRKRLNEIEREATRLLQDDAEQVCCHTAADLQVLQNKLRAFVQEQESRRDDILNIISILDEIEEEDQSRVAELFGKESLVTRYFHEATGGLYISVYLDQDHNVIMVQRNDGSILEASRLSGGAYDQLYLAVRLALGENIMKDEKGFFLLDDPFIKADQIRLERLLDSLMNIARQGWQIIYFTAKDEVKNILKMHSGSDTITTFSINGTTP